MAESYPLQWPEGWPRTPVQRRADGQQFSTRNYDYAGQGYRGWSAITFDRARRLLVDELDRMKAKSLVISTNIPVRSDGLPYSNDAKRRVEDPGVAIYFMLKGKQMVMAQDLYNNVPANLRSLGMAIEAMRALERHGGGTMTERAFRGFSALPPPEGEKPRRPWWEVMRYSADPAERVILSPAEIKARYNTLAKQRHPDAGGSTEEMSELNAALEDAQRDLAGETETA